MHDRTMQDRTRYSGSRCKKIGAHALETKYDSRGKNADGYAGHSAFSGRLQVALA